MPQYGTGIIPSGAIGDQLGYLTRRGCVYRNVVQIYNASPTLALFMSHANAASGGVSPITIAAQVAPLTAGGWTDYSGSFPAPQEMAGIVNAEFNMKALVVPVPLPGMQGLVQINETIIDLLEAKMNDASLQAINLLTTALFNNYTNNQEIIGLPGAVDDGTNLVTYGGISRTTYPVWKANVISEGTVAPTRDTVLFDIVKTVSASGGERPTFGVMGPLTWATLATDFVASERFLVSPDGTYADNAFGAKSGFQALMVGGVPIYMEPNMPEGAAYYLNDNYCSLYIHEDASFGFLGFESTLPNNQIGYIGALLSIMEFVVAKPKSCTYASGYTHLTT